MPYELKPRDVEWRLVTDEQLLQRQKKKVFLHYIVTGHAKWIIHYDNPKHRRSLGHASTLAAQPNIDGSKLLVCI